MLDTFFISSLSFLQTTAPIRARVLYERLVTFFPTSGRYWRLYIEQEVTYILSSRICGSEHDLCPFFLLSLSSLSYFMSIGVCCHDNQSMKILFKKHGLLGGVNKIGKKKFNSQPKKKKRKNKSSTCN